MPPVHRRRVALAAGDLHGSARGRRGLHARRRPAGRPERARRGRPDPGERGRELLRPRLQSRNHAPGRGRRQERDRGRHVHRARRSPTSCTPPRSPWSARCRSTGCSTRCPRSRRAARSGCTSSRRSGLRDRAGRRRAASVGGGAQLATPAPAPDGTRVLADRRVLRGLDELRVAVELGDDERCGFHASEPCRPRTLLASGFPPNLSLIPAAYDAAHGRSRRWWARQGGPAPAAAAGGPGPPRPRADPQPRPRGRSGGVGAEPVVCDIEALDDISACCEGADAVVFAAGAGPGSGAERKRTVDYGGAVKLMDAARSRHRALRHGQRNQRRPSRRVVGADAPLLRGQAGRGHGVCSRAVWTTRSSVPAGSPTIRAPDS